MQSANPQTITDAKFAENGKILEPKGHGEDLPLGFIEREIRKISSLQSQEKDPETSKRKSWATPGLSLPANEKVVWGFPICLRL